MIIDLVKRVEAEKMLDEAMRISRKKSEALLDRMILDFKGLHRK